MFDALVLYIFLDCQGCPWVVQDDIPYNLIVARGPRGFAKENRITLTISHFEPETAPKRRPRIEATLGISAHRKPGQVCLESTTVCGMKGIPYMVR